MLITLPAANIQEKLGKVCGHRFTPASREELKKLQQLAPRLRELGVERIVCSDLDGQSGAALARRLNVPVEEWQCLRRFNAGKLHGTESYKFQKLYDSVQAPEVPIKGGDSHASFSKRMAAAHDRLVTIHQQILVIADAAVLEELAGAGGAVRYHIYDVRLREQSNPTPTLAATAKS